MPREIWVENHGGDIYNICEDCPFEKYINTLAEYEDSAEKLVDDGK